MRLKYKHINLSEVDSTNSYLSALNSEVKLEEGTVVTASSQLKGKGQTGNIWLSKKGENLTFSILLKPNLDTKFAFYLNIVTALAVHKTLNDLQITSEIKWPNDILVSQKKIAGILIENQIGSCISQSIIGIGLNVNQTQFNGELKATSIALEQGQNELNEVQNQLLGYFDFYYTLLKNSNFTLLLKLYYKNLFWYQKFGVFNTGDSNFKAKLLGISDIGFLKLQSKNGIISLYDLKDIKFIY